MNFLEFNKKMKKDFDSQASKETSRLEKFKNISEIPQFWQQQKLYNKVQHIPLSLSLSCVVAINFRQHIMLTYVVRHSIIVELSAHGYIKSEKTIFQDNLWRYFLSHKELLSVGVYVEWEAKTFYIHPFFRMAVNLSK